jgi:hypothetical protein
MGTYDVAVSRRLTKLAGGAAIALAVTGCSMGNLFGGGASPATTYANTSASSAEIAAAAPLLPAIATECPPIKVRNGQEALFAYSNNAQPNPRQLRYQAVLDKQSRNCVVSNGVINVRMGVVGRVLLGPAGQAGSYDLPLRFSVERDEVALYSERYQIPVQVTAPAQSAEFVQVVENVSIPYVGGENITIWVGFDSGRS